MLGNKVDKEEDRAVNGSKAKAWAQSRDFGFFETSARDGTNIEDCFQTIAKLALKQSEKVPEFKPTYGGKGNVRLMAA